MSQHPLVPFIRSARRLPPLAVATTGAFIGATVVALLWGRPEPVVIEAAPAPSCPDLVCADLVCPDSPVCPSLTCAAVPESPPAPVRPPPIQVEPTPAARAWSRQLSKHIDEVTSPDELGYSGVALAGDFVVAVIPYIPEEECAATVETSVARAYDRETGNVLWAMEVDDRTSLGSTSAGLLVINYNEGPDTNSVRLLDRNKQIAWSTALDECRAYQQRGGWLVDNPLDPRCARDLVSGAVYQLPKDIRDNESMRVAYWKQLGLPSPRVKITCPKVDNSIVYASACDERGTAQVNYKCSGKNCRADVDYTPWNAPVRGPAAP